MSVCAECGDDTGVIQLCAIAWPNGKAVELWLHRECEQAALERLEPKAPNPL
jgi:hypothetical protein